MSSMEQGLYELGWLDQFSSRDTPVHRVDPRAKVVATLVFLVCVVSFDKYDVLGLVPFVVFPVVLASESGMPYRELAKRLAVAAPFALVIGIFNPILDQQVVGNHRSAHDHRGHGELRLHHRPLPAHDERRAAPRGNHRDERRVRRHRAPWRARRLLHTAPAALPLHLRACRGGHAALPRPRASGGWEDAAWGCGSTATSWGTCS